MITAIAPRPSGRRAHARTRTPCTPTACSASFFELGRSRSAPPAARSTSSRTSSRRRPLDIPPFVLRGEVEESSATWGGPSAGRPREGRAARGVRPVHRPASRAYEADQPFEDNDEETRRALPAAELHRLSTRRSSWCSGSAAPAARAEATHRQRDAGAHRDAHPHGPAAGPHGDEPRRPRPACSRSLSSTPEELIAAADASRPRLLEEQTATEERTRHSEELHETFRELGVYRLLQPDATAAWRWTCPPSTADDVDRRG